MTWTQGEIDYLVSQRERKVPYKEIAKVLERKVSTLRKKYFEVKNK